MYVTRRIVKVFTEKMLGIPLGFSEILRQRSMSVHDYFRFMGFCGYISHAYIK